MDAEAVPAVAPQMPLTVSTSSPALVTPPPKGQDLLDNLTPCLLFTL